MELLRNRCRYLSLYFVSSPANYYQSQMHFSSLSLLRTPLRNYLSARSLFELLSTLTFISLYCLSAQSLTQFIDFDEYLFDLYLNISWHTSVNFYLDLYLSTYHYWPLLTYLCWLPSWLISLNVSLSLMLLDWCLSSLLSHSHNSFSRILLSPYSLIVYLFLDSPLALIRPLVAISSVILLHWDNLLITILNQLIKPILGNHSGRTRAHQQNWTLVASSCNWSIATYLHIHPPICNHFAIAMD
jgi:hypothetical protein